MYLDNIVVYSNTLEEHHKHVQEVLKRLRDAGIYLKLSKCEFNTKRIGFVSFIVIPHGVEMEPDRSKTVTE
jgi:hypothetical protein